jgi:hypothetical protein
MYVMQCMQRQLLAVEQQCDSWHLIVFCSTTHPSVVKLLARSNPSNGLAVKWLLLLLLL